MEGKRRIFVFGSNLAGRHGAGAALYALRHHGAKYGHGVGLQGDSYGIPTKGMTLRTLPLNEIEGHVKDFISFATINPHLRFKLTAIGCGLAGYTPMDIAPMFRDAPSNVEQPPEFLSVKPESTIRDRQDQ